MKGPDDLRILLVNGEPFSDATATGITLSNLFEGIHRDRMAQIYTADLPVRDDMCATYLKLSPSNLIAHRRRPPGGQVEAHTPIRRIGPAPAAARRFIAPLLECLSYRLDSVAQQKLRQFAPNIVYTLGGSVRQLQLALDVTAQLAVPLAIHFMDDWPATLYRTLWMAPIRSRLKRQTEETVRRACARLVISEAMAREYESRYGQLFIPFMNCVDRSKVALPEEASRPIRKLCYFGGLHLGRGEVMMIIAEAIERVGLSGELGIDLFCRASDAAAYRSAFGSYRALRFRDPVPPNEVVAIMQSADALLHVESFATAHREYTRLSISTKIPEYLAAGRPILAIGPAEVASMQYLQNHRAAVVVTDTAIDEVMKGLLELRKPTVAATITKNAHNLVMEHHLAEVERKRFRNVLAEAAFS